MVLYLGFPASFDEWKAPADVSQVLVDSYEELLREAAEAADNEHITGRAKRGRQPAGKGGKVAATRFGRIVKLVVRRAPK